MQQDLNKSSEPAFFALMAEAEQIQVQEVESKQPLLETERTFLVKIRAASTAPVSPAAPVVSSTPVKENDKDRERMIENAHLLLSSGEFILARNIFSFLLKGNLKDQRAMEGLGLCFIQLNELLPAKKCFKALWELYQKEDYAARLGLCYLAEQDDESALYHFSKVQSPEKMEPKLRFEFFKAYGNILNRREQLQTAEALYQKALELNPQSEAIYVNLGTLELQRKNLSVAQKYFMRATQIQPRNSKAHCGLGMVDLGQGDFFSAGREFQVALDCDCQNTVALLQLIYLADYSKNYTEVKPRIYQFLDREPKNGEIRFQLASILFRQGHFLEAENELDKATLVLPKDQRLKKLKEHLTINRHRG